MKYRGGFFCYHGHIKIWEVAHGKTIMLLFRGDGAMNINMETGAEAAENAAAADAGTDDTVCHCRHKHRTEKREGPF